jgi:DNA (cytosine-5)-methyltransferase 1
MNVLDLFSGIGGFSLGLERAGMRTVAFCEIDPYCRAVLRKHWPSVPIFEDVRSLAAEQIGPVDLVCGGFPCQDISSAGTKRGLAGRRSGLWSEFRRLLCEIRPTYAILENVADITSRGLGDILRDLAEIGMDAWWHVVPASYVGLPQPRYRLWLVAYPRGRRCAGWSQWHFQREITKRRDDNDGLALAKRRAWEAASRIRRMDDGLPHGMDRLRALGNAVVPQIPEIIGRAIMRAEGLT